MGVAIAASTQEDLESFATFLEETRIPVACVSVGDVSKDDF